MLPIPAIDMKDGKCVRLRQGKMDDATIFSDSIVDMASYWVDQGTKRLHLVDLNGAFAGSPKNAGAVFEIAKRYPDLTLQIGGGIRDEATASHYWDLGVDYCIFGSKAVTDTGYVKELSEKYPKKIILGIDASNGMVATDGWAKVSTTSAIDLAQQFSEKCIEAIIYTDIAKDGMMAGANITQTRELAKATTIPVIASGGISKLSDLEALQAVEPALAGAILGRSLYEKAFSLAQALSATNN